MSPIREPIRPPKIRKYRVMVIAGGTRVWPQMRRMRATSRRATVYSAVQLRCASLAAAMLVEVWIWLLMERCWSRGSVCRARVLTRLREACAAAVRRRCSRGLLRLLRGVVAGHAHEQLLEPVGLGAHRAHADAGGVEFGEHAVEVHRPRHVEVQR